MKQLIALYLLTGIIRKVEVNQYWSTNPLFKTPFFNNVIPRNRFQLTFEFSHFNDNSNYNPQDPNRDRLFKICPVLDYLMDKFKSVYTPDKHIAIDEELLLWKGRLGFKHTFQTRELVSESKCSQFVKFLVTSGTVSFMSSKNANVTLEEQAIVKELGKSSAVVPKLMSDLYSNGYHLYVDNWYASERLFKLLSENGTFACGTAIGNRLKVPQSLKEEPLEKGDYACR